jgi:phosphoribosyl 1,2-cyclic phosphodiesterase
MSIKFTILGCGYSMGVPRIDGYLVNVTEIIKKIIERDVQL